MFNPIINNLSSAELALLEARSILTRIHEYLCGPNDFGNNTVDGHVMPAGIIPRITASTTDVTCASLDLLEALKAFAIALGVPDVCLPSANTNHPSSLS